MARLTLERIAELAGVSRSTVSRVITGHKRVRPEVRARVQEIISQTGYRPDQAAQALASRRSAAPREDARDADSSTITSPKDPAHAD